MTRTSTHTAPARRGALSRLAPFALALSIVSVGCDSDAKMSAERHLTRADEFLVSGELKRAVIELKNTLQEYPKETQARWLLGKTYLDLGHPQSAVKELMLARELGLSGVAQTAGLLRARLMLGEYQPVLDTLDRELKGSRSEPAYALLRGQAELGLGRLEQAGATFAAVAESHPDEAGAPVGLARVAQARGDLDEAARQARAALSASPEDVEAWLLSGELALARGDLDEAKLALEKVMAIVPAETWHHASARVSLFRILLARNDLEAAEPYITELLESYPGNPTVQYLSAELALSRNDPEAAQQALQSALKAAPNHAPSLLQLGILSHAQGEYEQALSYLNRYVALVPADPAGYKRVAATHLALRESRAAIDALRNGVSKVSDDPGMLAMLGTVYLRTGELGPGMSYLERALELAPDDPAFHVELARAYFVSGDSEKAIGELESAVESDTDSLGPAITLTYVHLQNRDFEAAFDTARGLARRKPGSPIPLALEGLIYSAQGNPEEARKRYEKALAVDPSAATPALRLAALDRQAGQPAAARERYEQVVARGTDDPEAFIVANLNLAQLDRQAGDAEAAERHLKSILELEANEPRALIALARIAAARGDEAGALEQLERAREHNPRALTPRLFLGTRYLRTGKVEEGLALAKEAYRLAPYDLRAIKLLGVAYLQADEPKRAVEVLRAAAEKRGEDAHLLALLGRAYTQGGDPQKGTQYLERASALAPDSSSIRTELGSSRFGQGRVDEGISELVAAMELDTELTTPGVLLVLAHLNKGELDRALTTATRLAAEHPDSAVYHNLLGSVHLRRAEAASARAEFTRAIELAPKYRTATLNLARLDVQSGDMESARVRYESVLADDGGNTSYFKAAALGLAEIERRSGNLDAAKARYLAILKRIENDPIAMAQLARIEDEIGRPLEAIRLLEQARRRNPQALEPRLVLVSVYLREGYAREALVVAREAQTLSPKNPQVLATLGQTQLAAGEPLEALATFKRLAALNPNQAGIQDMIALAAGRAGDLDTARDALEKSGELKREQIEGSSASIPMQVNLAHTLLRTGRIDEASGVADELIRQFPDSEAGFALEGDIRMLRGQFEPAATAYEKAFTKRAGAGLALKWSRARMRAGDSEGAIDIVRGWLGDHPDDVNARFVLASTLHQAGRLDSAIEEYERVLSASPDVVPVLNNLSWLYHERGERRGLELAQRAHELASSDPNVLDTYGWLLVQDNQHQKGISLLKQALQKTPNDGQVRYHLGVAYARAGEIERAREELQAALDSRQSFPEKSRVESMLEQLK